MKASYWVIITVSIIIAIFIWLFIWKVNTDNSNDIKRKYELQLDSINKVNEKLNKELYKLDSINKTLDSIVTNLKVTNVKLKRNYNELLKDLDNIHYISDDSVTQYISSKLNN